MKRSFKVGDMVAAKVKVGKVVEITPTKIVIEVIDKKAPTGIRRIEMNEAHSNLRGTTFAQMLDEFLVRVVVQP